MDASSFKIEPYANLHGAPLGSAELIDAKLRGANLRNAVLIDADLSGALCTSN